LPRRTSHQLVKMSPPLVGTSVWTEAQKLQPSGLPRSGECPRRRWRWRWERRWPGTLAVSFPIGSWEPRAAGRHPVRPLERSTSPGRSSSGGRHPGAPFPRRPWVAGGVRGGEVGVSSRAATPCRGSPGRRAWPGLWRARLCRGPRTGPPRVQSLLMSAVLAGLQT
jgi:hypothetical protein